MPGEGGGNGSDDAGIAPFRDVRDGFEQRHGSTLRCWNHDPGATEPGTALPDDSLTRARPAPLSAVCGSRLSDRVGARRPRHRGATRLPLRAGARHRGGCRRSPVARPRRPNPAALARARRGGVLRHLLLRIRDPLLPRPGRQPRRPGADPCRAAALQLLAHGGAAAPSSRARDHGRRARCPGDRGRAYARRLCRQELPDRGCGRDTSSPTPRAPAVG